MTPQAARMNQEFTDHAGAPGAEAAYLHHRQTGQRLSAAQIGRSR